jgi:hypothetical protein
MQSRPVALTSVVFTYGMVCVLWGLCMTGSVPTNFWHVLPLMPLLRLLGVGILLLLYAHTLRAPLLATALVLSLVGFGWLDAIFCSVFLWQHLQSGTQAHLDSTGLTRVGEGSPLPRRVAWTGRDWLCYGFCLGCASLGGVLLGLAEDIRNPPSFLGAVALLPLASLTATAVLVPLLSTRLRRVHLLALAGVGLALSGLAYGWAGPPALVDSMVRSQLKNLATGLEMYASDNHGHYPVDLQVLYRQNYLGPHTAPDPPPIYERSQQPAAFTLTCHGRFRHRRGDGPWIVVDQATLRNSSWKGMLEPPEFR